MNGKYARESGAGEMLRGLQHSREKAAGGDEASGGDTNHPGTGLNSIVIGASAIAATSRSVVIGYQAEVNTGAFSIAIGGSSYVEAGSSTAVGDNTYIGAEDSVAVGEQAAVYADSGVAVGQSSFVNFQGGTALGAAAGSDATRAIAIGRNAHVDVDDRCVIKANDLEVTPSDGVTLATSVILADSTGTRWRIGVDTSGNPVGLGAA